MKVLKYTGSPIAVRFAGEGLWRLTEKADCAIHTVDGVLRYTLLPGFPTNMRSGSHVIDPIIPKFTDSNDYNWAIIVHDANYTKNCKGGHFLSRLLADQLLCEMARVSGTLNTIQRALMYRSLRMFGNSAYECENTGEYAGAEFYMSFTWDAK
ncbi:MAG: hypothetical protein FWC15_00460 [Fibromonadales bacterium]|nr:hypothetical protein [Fibromonadales bacterium]